MSRILCIEDERAIRRLLEVVLIADGHEVLCAGTAREALSMLHDGSIDAVLLDLGLPDRDGLEMIPAIRAVVAAPVIVVSARSDVTEKVAALDLGAADYVTKPFDGEELRARVRAALRGPALTSADDRLCHGPVTIDLGRHRAEVSGRPVSLTPKEFALLTALVRANGRIVTHAALLERIWGKAHVDDVEYLRVAVRALRLKMEVDPANPTLIRNEPGIGYRLG